MQADYDYIMAERKQREAELAKEDQESTEHGDSLDGETSRSLSVGDPGARRKSVMSVRARPELPDVGLLKAWYMLDENAVPSVYRLQKIRCVVDGWVWKTRRRWGRTRSF